MVYIVCFSRCFVSYRLPISRSAVREIKFRGLVLRLWIIVVGVSYGYSFIDLLRLKGRGSRLYQRLLEEMVGCNIGISSYSDNVFLQTMRQVDSE